MFIPQVFFYGVVGTATAVMNSRRRFALAAGAPAIENLGTIAVLVAAAVIFGSKTNVTNVPSGEILLLGLGSTAPSPCTRRRSGGEPACRGGAGAARRVARPRGPVGRPPGAPVFGSGGAQCRPDADPPGVANRLAGGVVAFQIALNFYYLAIAIGATPVALSLLPRLARMHLAGDRAAFQRHTRARPFAGASS